MMKSNSVRATAHLVLLFAWGLTASGADPEQANPTTTSPVAAGSAKTTRVAAQVVESNDGLGQPERRIGAFTIPPGSLGTDLKYRYHDPNADYSSTELKGSSLFSVTENRYLRELEFVPIYKLPPGEYQFIVGGTPGSSGELTVTVVPGTPPTNVTKTPPPATETNPPTTPPDDDTSATMKALEGTWAGIYTVDKITGNVDGLGQVLDKRFFSIKMRRDDKGMHAEGSVWMPPGWFGRAGGGTVDPGNVVRFYVQSKLIKRGVLSIYYSGVYDLKSNSMKGTLIGYMPKGESSEAVFEGTWYLNPR